MTAANDLVERYFVVWNETDARRRQAVIERTWTEDAGYVDPMIQSEGHAGISAMVQGVQDQFPGYRFRQIGTLDTHHDHVRFSWELAPADGPAVAAGTDVAIIAPDGRLRTVIGFLDQAPAGL